MQSYKNKSFPFTTVQALKCREIFSQSGHPLQQRLARVGRALTVLVKTYTQAFITLQLLDQTHMVNGYLKLAKAFFAEKGIPVAGFELDVVRMFPSLDRTTVFQGYRKLAKRYLATQDRKQGTKGKYTLWVSIAKGGDRAMDGLGRKSTQDYWVCRAGQARRSVQASRLRYDLGALHNFVLWDLFGNDIFALGAEIGVLATGVAIGGFMSAQHADIGLNGQRE